MVRSAAALALVALLLPAERATAQNCSLWSATLPGLDDPSGIALRQLAGGDLLYLHREQDGFIDAFFASRLDPGGNVIWTRKVNRRLTEAEVRSDGSAYLTGSLTPLWWGLLDGTGTLTGAWRVGALAGDAEGAVATQDGGVAVVGTGFEYGCGYESHLLHVCRLRPDGTVQWSRRITYANLYYGFHVRGHDVTELPDGSVVVAGTESGDLLLSRLDANGSPLWLELLDDPFVAGISAVELLPDGNLAVMSSGAGAGLMVAKVDLAGMVVWAARLSGLARDMRVTPAGEILLAGQVGGDARLLALDASGAVLWDRAYDGGTANDWFLSVDSLSPPGIAVAGSTGTFGNRSATLMRLDVMGFHPDCPSSLLNTSPQAIFPTVYVNMDLAVENDNSAGPSQAQLLEVDRSVAHECLVAVGVNYCTPATPNSTGGPATIRGHGSECVVINAVSLIAESMPPNQFGYFLTGMGMGTVIPPGSQGTLCLSGSPIHRYAKDAASTGPGGSFSLTIDISYIPGLGGVQAGETWNYQAWFRDNNPGATSNFTDGLAVTFQ